MQTPGSYKPRDLIWQTTKTSYSSKWPEDGKNIAYHLTLGPPSSEESVIYPHNKPKPVKVYKN
jgi:hypothetical protein